MLDYPKVYAFCEVADCLSFTEAANRLYTTQSSLSKNIANLENTIGCQLFIRNNRNVTLTPAGAYLYDYFRNSLEDMHQAIAHAREINEGTQGQIKIGILGLGSIIEEVSSLFLGFHKAYPMYGYEFSPMMAKETRDFLIARKIGAVITSQQNTNLLVDCDYKVIYSSNLVVIARTDHPLFYKYESPSLSDLKDCGFVLISPYISPHTYQLALKACEIYGFSPKVRILADTLFGLMMNVASSDYISIVSECDSRDRSGFRQIPIKYSDTVNTVLAWNRNNVFEPLQKLIEYLDAFSTSKETI